VIFEVQLFKGMSYTVEAERGDFYNARDKKLVEYQKKHKVIFTDGERLHLWVPRQFSGALLLKADGRVLGRYEPNALDPARYDDEPATKPAPLIVVLKNDAAPAPFASTGSSSQGAMAATDDPLGIARTWKLTPVSAAYADSELPILTSLSAPAEPEHATVVVVDANERDMPRQVLDHLAGGGGKSGLVDVDANEVATRNWLYSQVAAAAAYAGDNWNWLRQSVDRQANGVFRLVKAQISYARGKARIYFSGYSKKNPVFLRGGHGSSNAKILQIYSGVGSTSSTFTSAAKGVAGTFKGFALVSFVFGSAASFAEWQADVQKDGYDLAAMLLMGFIKAVVAAAIAVAVVALLVTWLMAGLLVSVAALVIGLLTVVLGVVATYVVDALDKYAGKAWKGSDNSDGLAAGIAPWLRSAGTWINTNWQYLMTKLETDYKKLSY
jgi:hypothetical protein